MALEMKVPSPGESITEVEIAAWLVNDGDYVEKDQAIAEVDSDKATLELPAEASGIITLKAEEGDTVAVGEVVCLIDTDAKKPGADDETETYKNPGDESGGENAAPDLDKEKAEETKKKKEESNKAKAEIQTPSNLPLPIKSRIKKPTLQAQLLLPPKRFLMKKVCLQKT